MRIVSHLLLLLLVAVCLTVSCDKLTSVEKDGVTVSLVEDGIRIKNESESTIGYMAIERETANVIDWAPLCTPDNEIKIDKSTVVDYSSITNYTEGKEILVYFWQCPYSNGYGIHSIVITGK